MRLPIEIENVFESGATVLTANVRAARWLRREYALRQREAGRRVWASPPIEDWDSWLVGLWQAHGAAQADAPLLLTSLQERSVWTRMQRDDAKLLVSPEGMAALAEEAYGLLCEYEAHAERDRAWGQTDAERFRQWAAAFDRECARQGWMSRARLESLVTEAVGDLPLPAKIVLVGFDRITPSRKRLISVIEARGVEVLQETGAAVEASPRLVRATDRRDEITACAHWIRALLDESPLFEKSAPVRIGVIVPELGRVRSEIERIFRRVLMPETDDVFATASRMPFEFSLGQPLASVPVIRAALLLLRWAAGPLSEEEVSWLLLSGYLGVRDQGSGIRDQESPPPTQAKTGLEWGTVTAIDSPQRREEFTTEDTESTEHRAQGSGVHREDARSAKGFTTGDTESTEGLRSSEGDGTAGPSTAVASQPIAPTPGAPGTPASQPPLGMTSIVGCAAPLGMTSMDIYLALGSFDAGLRNSGSLSLEIGLRDVLREMRRFPALAGVHARLEEMRQMAAMNHVKDEERSPGRWVDLAQVLLDKAGWRGPGLRGVGRRDEIDFQARARWERLLDEVALLDFDGRRVRYRDFVEILETQAGEMIFAVESHGAPVQVMGAMEASGQQFDAAWFLGVDDQSWPTRGRLHPLLPNDVQKRAGMPHATADDDWELAATATKRIVASVAPAPGLKIETWGTQSLQSSAASGQRSETEHRAQSTELSQGAAVGGQRSVVPTFRDTQDGAPGVAHSKPKAGFDWGTQRSGMVVFSHAERDKDGELRPSPLIGQIAGHAHSKPTPGFEWGAETVWQRSRELLHELGVEGGIHAAAKLEEITDASGVIAWPREECAGGYSVIRDQAACPFRAFAARRLNAEELNRSEWGLDARQRGLLLHRVVELLWSPEKGRIHTLADLQAAIAEGRLRAVIEETIGEVFAQLMKEHSGDAWMVAYLRSEQRRLAKLLEEYLREHEAKRVPFTVESTEKRLDDVSVGGLKLRLRTDRVDVVGQGQRLLVDYKSGEVSTKDWEGERLNEPQLPLYAVFGNVEDVAGVLFARIRVGETDIEGYVSDARAQLFADVTASSKLVKNPYNEAMRKEWANALVNLAEDFLHGDARVDPKDGRKTCKFCEFPGVCRVAEMREAVGDDEAEPGEGDE